MLLNETAGFLLLAALVLDAIIGDPRWLWRTVPHPVVIMGRLITLLDDQLNRETWSDARRRIAGIVALAIASAASALVGWAIHDLAGLSPWTVLLEVVIVAVLLAQRSLYDHVDDVRRAFASGGLAAARTAVAQIVGRDPETLDEAGVCRASIESAAENFSDGIVAPALWYLIAGLPGILTYKMINTADSMIGHRTPRHMAFGWATARIDDLVNLIPARLSAALFALAAPGVGGSIAYAWRAVWRDARHHRSPNAGWPEAAMAGALGLALAGPRTYSDTVVEDAWMNAEGRRAATPADIGRALTLLIIACALHGLAIALLAGLLV